MKRIVFVLAFDLLVSVSVLGAAPDNRPPDLTKGQTEVGRHIKCRVDLRMTTNLGPTGMRAWMYSLPPTHFDGQQGRVTANCRQLLVTDIGDKTPAHGVMELGDVILGVNGTLFTGDARKGIARAITEAEKEENKGILKLRVWRVANAKPNTIEDAVNIIKNEWSKGKVMDVELRLDVMGSYSKTAPFNCPKSEKILANACQVLEKEMLEKQRPIWGSVSGLALLATGRPEYLPKVKQFARALAANEVKREGGGAWDCGYINLFLSEYYLLTKDKSVLPGIKAVTIKLAKGQSRYGSFGHGFSALTPEGKLHGIIPPYGEVNNAGLIANIGIVMGEKCGVEHPEIDPAIERGSKYFSYFVERGCIPYGAQSPRNFYLHDNNGKASQAAFLFAMRGNKWSNEARFWTKMALAAYPNREYGHTGQGFSFIWSALGPLVGGPEAASAFFKEITWQLDLARRSDGAFVYDGGEQYGPAIQEKNTYFDNNTYAGLSTTAAYVLTYAMPLKKLYVTGRAFDDSFKLSKKDLADVLDSAVYEQTRKKDTVDQLVAKLGDWSPIVHIWAAEELAKRPEAKAQVPKLMQMAAGSDKYAQMGALEALRHIKSEQALPLLVRLLEDEDRYIRVLAAIALQQMGEMARPYLDKMCSIIIETSEPEIPVNWKDPFQLCERELSMSVAKLTNRSLDGVQRAKLFEVVRVVAPNVSSAAREQYGNLITDILGPEEVDAIAPELLKSLHVQAGNHAFRVAAAKVLSKYCYKEGMKGILVYIKNMDPPGYFHGSESRVPMVLNLLKSYGQAAREILPELRERLAYYEKPHAHPQCQAPKVVAVKDLIAFIENSQDSPPLRSIKKSKEQP